MSKIEENGSQEIARQENNENASLDIHDNKSKNKKKKRGKKKTIVILVLLIFVLLEVIVLLFKVLEFASFTVVIYSGNDTVTFGSSIIVTSTSEELLL